MLDERQLKRFRNEARAAATLDHPHIVPVHAIGCERGVHFYAMSLVNGRTLAQVIADLRADSPESGSRTAEPDGERRNTVGEPIAADDPTIDFGEVSRHSAEPDAETRRNVQAAISTDHSVRNPSSSVRSPAWESKRPAHWITLTRAG